VGAGVGCGLEGVGSGLGCGAGAGTVSGFGFGSGGCGFGLRMLYVTQKCHATGAPTRTPRTDIPTFDLWNAWICFALIELVLCGLGVRNFREAIAVVVLAVRYRSQIVGSDTDAAVVTPNGLGHYGGCGLCFRSLHIFFDLLVRGTIFRYAQHS
jgi:hypothetical protein